MIPNLSASYTYTSYSESVQYSNSSVQNPARVQNTSSEEVKQSNSSESIIRADSFDIDALVSQIWGFASNRIEQAKADGASSEELESLWQAAESGVKQGFSEAKDILSELGEDSEALTLKIDSAFGQIADRLAERDLNSSQALLTIKDSPAQVNPTVNNEHSSSTNNRSIAVYQYEKQTFELSLTTQQGDKILITALSEQESELYDVKDGRFSSTQWGTRQDNGYSLVIEGDLNEQERADLDALLAQVNELAYEFYEGDYQTAFNMASDLNINGTSLQSMDLSLKEIEQKGVSAYSEMANEQVFLPKGLQPLKAYAEKLIAAQESWFEQFSSRESFVSALSNHPLNNQSFSNTIEMLIS